MNTTNRIEALLGELLQGQDAAREALLEESLTRIRFLAQKMFRRQTDLRAQAETDDLLSRAMLRLYRALAAVHPPNARAFFGLASTHMRWVLTDLAREMAASRVQFVAEPGEPPAPTDEPTDLLEWADFHTRVAALPDAEREVFDLVFYQGMEQAEAADTLGVSLRTLKRLWQRARLLLQDAMQGGSEG